MAYFTYILKSLKDGKYYIGSTADVDARVVFHNEGKQQSTKHRIPLTLIHKEEYPTRELAMAREKQIKSYKGGNAFKKLLNLL